MTLKKEKIQSLKLLKATPDIVNISDISSILGHSRQYTRKLFNSETSSLPAPIHIGNPSIWHLSEVLDWLKSLGKQENKINENLFELSHITKQINIKRQLEAY